jgi:hypothetical protein
MAPPAASIGYHGIVKRLAAFVLTALALHAADSVKVFGREWSVPAAADWKIDREGGVETMRLFQPRGPAAPPAPRRPIQFALTGDADYASVTVEAEVKPLGRSLILVFAYRDEAHFDYAHFSTDTAAKQPVHNGVFHVYGGERVRISGEGGPAAFPASGQWYRIRLTHDARTGRIDGFAGGKPLPSLKAVDLSLGGGRVGIGSFDETAEFRNVRIVVRRAGSR